ncbi:hypothetical protein K492DRAFT_32862 [Lichtheimia hyalospora FSU 10163]|nr:hypothetical protein K492DRAFT_32862 [Lichtheimia hyalospora FSU 10163]
MFTCFWKHPHTFLFAISKRVLSSRSFDIKIYGATFSNDLNVFFCYTTVRPFGTINQPLCEHALSILFNTLALLSFFLLTLLTPTHFFFAAFVCDYLCHNLSFSHPTFPSSPLLLLTHPLFNL